MLAVSIGDFFNESHEEASFVLSVIHNYITRLSNEY